MLNLLIVTWMIYTTKSQSYNLQFQDNGPITPVLNAPPFGYVDIDGDGMLIHMEINIESLPPSDGNDIYYNIFMIGGNLNRQPAIYIDSRNLNNGFLIQFSPKARKFEPFYTMTQLEADTTYEIDIYYTSTDVYIFVDGSITNDATKTAPTTSQTNLEILIGGEISVPAASTVTVSYIVIVSDIEKCRLTLHLPYFSACDEEELALPNIINNINNYDDILNEIKLLIFGLFGFIFISILIMIYLWNKSIKTYSKNYKVVNFQDVDDAEYLK